MLFSLMLFYSKDLKAQVLEAVFIADVTIDNLVDNGGNEIPGIYHVNINIDGYPGGDVQCSFMDFSLQFDFKDGNAVVYTHEIETHFVGNNSVYNSWRTEDFIQDFIVYVPPPGCSGATYDISEIDNVDITSTYDKNCLSSLFFFNDSITIHYPDPSVSYHVIDCLDGPANPECMGTSYTQNIAGISLPENVPLDFIVAESHNACHNSIDAAAWTAYALPYGGCPDYSHSWTYFDGTATQQAEHIDTAEYIGGIQTDEVIWGRINTPYSVTVTDQSSPAQTATASDIYFDDFVDLIEGVSFVPKTSCTYTVTVDLADWLPIGIAKIFDYPYDPNAAGAGMVGNTITRSAGTYVIRVIDPDTQCQDFYTVELSGGVTAIDGPLYINSPTTWSPTAGEIFLVSGKVYVANGGILDIENARVEFAGPDAGIIVERGGKLYVGNSTLTAQSGSCAANPAYWWGIQVKGDLNYAHPNLSIPITAPMYSFGVVHIRENSIVEKAEVGVRVYDQNVIINKLYGGGIVVAESNASFLNCGIGIFMAPYQHKNRSRVRDCTFDVTFPLLDPTYSIAGFTHLYLVGVNLQTYNNRFSNTVSFTSPYMDIDERGTGIVSFVSTLTSGQNSGTAPDPSQGNFFARLYKGIDAYSWGGFGGNVQVLANEFNDVAKCITVNAGAYARIVDNIIKPLSPQYNVNETYGVYLSAAPGCLVSGNTFKGFPSSAPTVADTHYGIIARNTGEGGGRIHNNVFEQRFHAATQFEADNPYLEVTCNDYRGANNYDWLITNSSLLKDQGFCNPADPANSNPSLNQWHDCAGGGYHIGNYGAPFTLTYYNQPEYQPTCLDGSSINTPPCNDIGTSDCGPIYFKSSAQLKSELEQSTEEAEYRSKLNELMHSYLQEEKTDSAKMDLEAENKAYTDKILIATHTEEEDFATALAKLGQLPLNTADDVAFYDLMSAIIYDMTNGSGKTAGEDLTLMAESDPNGMLGVLAESALAYRTGTLYDRVPEKVAVAIRESFDENPLQLYPNPADNYVEIHLKGGRLPEGSVLQVFDKMGKLVFKKDGFAPDTLLPVGNLTRGIYLVHLQLPSGETATRKLTVIR